MILDCFLLELALWKIMFTYDWSSYLILLQQFQESALSSQIVENVSCFHGSGHFQTKETLRKRQHLEKKELTHFSIYPSIFLLGSWFWLHPALMHWFWLCAFFFFYHLTTNLVFFVSFFMSINFPVSTLRKGRFVIFVIMQAFR